MIYVLIVPSSWRRSIHSSPPPPETESQQLQSAGASLELEQEETLDSNRESNWIHDLPGPHLCNHRPFQFLRVWIAHWNQLSKMRHDRCGILQFPATCWTYLINIWLFSILLHIFYLYTSIVCSNIDQIMGYSRKCHLPLKITVSKILLWQFEKKTTSNKFPADGDRFRFPRISVPRWPNGGARVVHCRYGSTEPFIWQDTQLCRQFHDGATE